MAQRSEHAEVARGDPPAAWEYFLGGGDPLRSGTMFLATLYFALPLLGKSRPR